MCGVGMLACSRVLPLAGVPGYHDRRPRPTDACVPRVPARGRDQLGRTDEVTGHLTIAGLLAERELADRCQHVLSPFVSPSLSLSLSPSLSPSPTWSWPTGASWYR